MQIFVQLLITVIGISGLAVLTAPTILKALGFEPAKTEDP